MLVNALRQIRYYQSAARDGEFLIFKASFQRIVREIVNDVKRQRGSHFRGEYYFEKDALAALQAMSEHVMIMIMEMLYGLVQCCD
jgi:histone H3/H4